MRTHSNLAWAHLKSITSANLLISDKVTFTGSRWTWILVNTINPAHLFSTTITPPPTHTPSHTHNLTIKNVPRHCQMCSGWKKSSPAVEDHCATEIKKGKINASWVFSQGFNRAGGGQEAWLLWLLLVVPASWFLFHLHGYFFLYFFFSPLILSSLPVFVSIFIPFSNFLPVLFFFLSSGYSAG